MKVLVTGGTGVVGRAAVSELLKRGHSVRIVSRDAETDAEQWGGRVEPWPANISDAANLKGAADGSDVVLHVAGIIAESRPEITFQSVNVDGTRNMIREAERAGVGRFIYLSSLGADTGASDYHRSKRNGERFVESFKGGWMILRPGNVYGPGDDVMSLLLKMVRTLPAIPTIDGGEDPFQPIAVDDLARAIALSVERTDLHGRILELAGSEVSSIDDLIDRFSAITGRHPARIPIPGIFASMGMAVAEFMRVDLPINESQLTMLREGNVIRAEGPNALEVVFGITPTPLGEGLKRLADSQLEQLPDTGVGSLERKRIFADITQSKLSADELFALFRLNFDELTPGSMDTSAESGKRPTVEHGETLTMALPLRGNVQVRVCELTGRSATLVTLEGHPLAGAVRFLSEDRGDCVRFEVEIFDRAANMLDWIAMNPIGGELQRRTWESLLDRVIRKSGGNAPGGVQHEREVLDEAQAKLVEDWLRALVMEKRARENGSSDAPLS